MSVIDKILKKSIEIKSPVKIPVAPAKPISAVIPATRPATIPLVAKKNLTGQPIATFSKREKASQPPKPFFFPCPKCQSPIFWLSRGGTGPHCIDCEFPSSNLLIRKICAVAKNEDGSYRIFPVGDFPSLGIPPLSKWEQDQLGQPGQPIQPSNSPTLDAQSGPTRLSQPATPDGPEFDTSNDTSLITFLDADGATHVRLSRFSRDRSLQLPDETREQYEQRLHDGEQLAKYGDVLKSFHEKTNAKK